MNDEAEHRDPKRPGRRNSDTIGLELDAFVEQTNRRLRRIFIGALVAISVIGLATTVSLIGFGIVLRQQQRTQDQLAIVVKQNQKTARDIQNQRKDTIRTNCEQTNARYTGTRDALKKGSDLDQKNAPNAAARKEIRRRRDVTLSLLRVLSPFRNCDKEVAKAVKPTGG